MRLEYWAWNVIADRDMTIHPRYQRLELYGLTAFKVLGGGSGLWLYVRPMSLGKLLEYDKATYLDKEAVTKISDISVYPEDFKAKVFVDGVEVKIKSMQKIEEFSANNKAAPVLGYIINIPSIRKTDMPYAIIKVVGENTELNEKGENIYFYEFSDYQ
ncbi:MAG: hypothetical protein HRT66_08665 [Flavobacteriaceae bacterium]|nr:hypothetical protein [Flavobacteriaceae bacterium]